MKPYFFDVLKALTYGINNLKQEKEGREMLNAAENSEIQITQKPDKTMDIKMKGVPSGILNQGNPRILNQGNIRYLSNPLSSSNEIEQTNNAPISMLNQGNIKDLRPDIYQMYNMEQPKNVNELPLPDRARAEAQIQMASLQPEKPESGIMGFLKAIPLGGYKFDPRLGWGNVINALTAGAIGQEAMKQQYKQELLTYEKMKNQLTQQLENQEIEFSEYQQKMKEQEMKLDAINKANKMLYEPIEADKWAEQMFGSKELAQDFTGLAKMFGYGEEKDGRYFVNNAELAQMQQQLKSIFPNGMQNWIEMRLRNKLLETDDPKEKEKIQQQLDIVRQTFMNPNVEAQLEYAKDKLQQQREMEELKQQNRFKFANYREQLLRDRIIFEEELKDKKAKGQPIKDLLINRYKNLMGVFNGINRSIMDYEKAGITDTNRDDWEYLKGLRDDIKKELDGIMQNMKGIKEDNEGNVIKVEPLNVKKAKFQILNYLKSPRFNPNNKQELLNYLKQIQIQNNLTEDSMAKIFNEVYEKWQNKK